MKNKMKISTLAFIFPAIFIVFIFLILPIFQGALISFQDNNGNFVGLQNYISVFKDSRVINLKNLFKGPPPYGAMIHNIIWVLIHLPLSLFLGLGFALLMKNVWGKTIVRTLIFLGMVVPMVVGGIMVRFLFSKNSGLIPNIFEYIGIESLNINWIAHPQTALIALILTSVWLWTGYSMIVYIAALTTIPSTFYEAADIEGSSKWQTFKWITWPMLRNATGVIILMTVIWELKLFGLVYASTGGGPGNATNVMALEMYLTAFKFFEPGKGMAIAMILTIVVLIPISLSVKQTMRSQEI